MTEREQLEQQIAAAKVRYHNALYDDAPGAAARESAARADLERLKAELAKLPAER